MSWMAKAWTNSLLEILDLATAVPLVGYPPPFSWTACNGALATALQVTDFSLSCLQYDWRAIEALQDGLGIEPYTITLEASPISGNLFLCISSDDMERLCSPLLAEEKTQASRSLLQGFYRYTVLQALRAFPSTGNFAELSFRMSEDKLLPKEAMFSLEIQIECHTRHVYARLLIPADFLRSFKQFYHQKQTSQRLASPITATLDVPVRLTIGHTQVSLEEWEETGAGDLLLLDRCTYDINTHKGMAVLLLHTTPIFHVRLSKGKLAVLGHAHHHEEDFPMDDEIPEGTYHDQEPRDSEEYLDQEGLPPRSDYVEEVEHLVSHNEIPISLSIEVATMRINLHKLLHLQPGNVIELGIRPEEGVFLTAGNRRIGRGELVQIGDVLGVKILEIGH